MSIDEKDPISRLLFTLANSQHYTPAQLGEVIFNYVKPAEAYVAINEMQNQAVLNFDAKDAIQDRDRLIEELRAIVIAAKEITNNIDAYDVHPNGVNMHRIDSHIRFDKAVENFLNLVELP